jgi:hypothetical protein
VIGPFGVLIFLGTFGAPSGQSLVPSTLKLRIRTPDWPCADNTSFIASKIGPCLSRKFGYEHVCLRAEFEPERRCCTSIGWKDPRTEAGELLWPQRLDHAALEGLKASLGSYRYAGQFQQRPAPADGGMLKRHWWRYWQPRGANLPPVMVKLPDGIGALRLGEFCLRFLELLALK